MRRKEKEDKSDDLIGRINEERENLSLKRRFDWLNKEWEGVGLLGKEKEKEKEIIILLFCLNKVL